MIKENAANVVDGKNAGKLFLLVDNGKIMLLTRFEVEKIREITENMGMPVDFGAATPPTRSLTDMKVSKLENREWIEKTILNVSNQMYENNLPLPLNQTLNNKVLILSSHEDMSLDTLPAKEFTRLIIFTISVSGVYAYSLLPAFCACSFAVIIRYCSP